MPIATQKHTYNLTDVKDIPIVAVCDYLGIPVKKAGKNYWCRVRPEKDPSVILHTENNTFYDFGNQEHGSNIDLVCYATGKSFSQAAQALGEAFHLQPESREEMKQRFLHMSRMDYARIGLHADLSTKNFTFPTEHLSWDKLTSIEQRYQMSMNDLRKQHPKTYERIIREKAIPYVDQLRNQYYLNIWKYYNFLETFKRGYLFYDSDKTIARFKNDTENLERAEKALFKACHDTSLKASPGAQYDPMRVLSYMRQDRLNISLGNQSPEELVQLNHGDTAAIDISHDIFFHDKLTDYLSKIPHTATLTWDGVKLECSAKNFPQLEAFIHYVETLELLNKAPPEMLNERTSLADLIQAAKERTGSNQMNRDSKELTIKHQR